jgi:hypothetical protein
MTEILIGDKACVFASLPLILINAKFQIKIVFLHPNWLFK